MPKILILTTSHGASHRRASEAMKKAFLEIRPGLDITVVDAIRECAAWFRAYYDSYTIPLRYWPGLWRWIENRQHRSSSTNPEWTYRLGGRPLFRFIDAFAPGAIIATEVGVCELVAAYKRRTHSSCFLVGLELMDFNHAWVHPEVDLYPVVHADFGEELAAAGAERSKILNCGLPIDPAYSSLPHRTNARRKLGLQENVPLLLVLFGGAGFGKPRRIVAELEKVTEAMQTVFVAGRNRALETDLRHQAARRGPGRNWRVLGWVDNMHEWMAAADLLLSKPGGSTVMEAAACGLPLLVFDPLPGNEERTCRWLERWQAGIWIKGAAEIAPAIGRLIAHTDERSRLSEQVRRLARPRAAYAAAQAIVERCGFPGDS